MEFWAEFLFELLLEGSMEILGCQKVPVFLRFLAGLLVGGLYAAMLALGITLICNGFKAQDWALIAVGLGITALFAIFGILNLRKIAGRGCKND